MNQPSMQNWEIAWQNADVQSLQMQYLEDAIVFPVNKKAIFGNKNIGEFFKGGFTKLDVKFFPTDLIIEETIAFETGIFKDYEKGTENAIANGNYVLNWQQENGIWKIKFHTWTISNKSNKAFR